MPADDTPTTTPSTPAAAAESACTHAPAPGSRFRPPRCPYRKCRMHAAPTQRFYIHRGSYRASCRAEAVPRFTCRACKRSFSRQTFRLDYRDRRPECNERAFEFLVSGSGLRQTGRVLRLDVRSVQHKWRKIALGMRRLNRNLMRRLPAPCATYLLDEIETFEHSSILRLTIPVLIHRKSLAILAVDVAPIRRVPRQGSAKRKWLDRVEKKHGKRLDRSRASVRRVLGRFRRLLAGSAADLVTDEKSLYATQLRKVVGSRVSHTAISSKLPRTTYNELFPINMTDAMLRDNNGRLRHRSWLHSKKAERLRAQLELYVAYRNWHRPRTNRDEPTVSPGVALGICARAFSVAELLAWRQDWRDRSIHPTSADASCAIGRGHRAPAA